MLTPKKLAKLENNKVVELYEKLNKDLTNTIIKKLNNAGDISSYTKAQLAVLKGNGGKQIFYEALNKTNKLSKQRKKEIKDLFQELEQLQTEGYDELYDYSDVEYNLDSVSKQITDSIISRTNKELTNMTRSVAFRTQKEYINAVDDLYSKVITGGWSYDTAIKSTLIDLANKGVTLKSKGREYTLEASVKRNLFTSIQQTANEISAKIKDDIKADAVWIATTPYCRPTHRVINGVVMDLKEFEKKYEYLTEEPNCYHIVNYVIKDIFIPPQDKEEIKRINDKADTVYENRQKQNYYARQVRQKKKEVANIGNSSKDILQNKRKQLRNAQMKYRTFSKSVGLGVDYSQTWQAGYNGLKRGI